MGTAFIYNYYMNNTQNLNVNDTIYIRRFTGYDYEFRLVKVIKKTPTGKIDVSPLNNPNPTYTIRFRADGREEGVGVDRFRAYEIDNKTVAERDALLGSKKRANVAAQAISNVRTQERITGAWGKESLMTEIERLEALLNTAREAVEAI